MTTTSQKNKDLKRCEQCGKLLVTRTGKPSGSANGKKRNGGGPCTQHPMHGQRVCKTHGGLAKQNLAAGARRQQEAEASVLVAKALRDAYGDEVPEIDPAEAMLRAVSWKYAECVALRTIVRELEHSERVWGVVRETVDSGAAGEAEDDKDDESGPTVTTVSQAGQNVWWVRKDKAERDLVQFAAAARAAGSDERRVELAHSDGLLLADVVRRILNGMYTALVALLGENEAGRVVVESAWPELVTQIVPAELSAVAAGVDPKAAS